MRFALAATAAAAIVAVPLAMKATGPALSGDQFLSEVRCAALSEVLGGIDPAARLRLNAEARRQPAQTAEQAMADVKAIALQAVNIQTAADMADLSREQAAACSGTHFAVGRIGPEPSEA